MNIIGSKITLGQSRQSVVLFLFQTKLSQKKLEMEKKEPEVTSSESGEFNLAYQVSESDPEWPSFKEKLARFNSRFASADNDKTQQASDHPSSDEKAASPSTSTSSGLKSSVAELASPNQSMASTPTIPSSPGSD